ncbi:MAG: SRPBCC domain-containing protein [Pseudolysinimonas sp.]
MTIERRLARSGFTLTRDYPAAVERVWNAFADETEKLSWWGAGDAIEPGEWVYDFRVGGRDVAEGKFHDGPVSRYEATYTDIVEHVRIVTTYDMWIDGVHMSTSVASWEFEPLADADVDADGQGGTRFTHVEHGVFFDQFWADGPNREAGTRGLLTALGNYLA